MAEPLTEPLNNRIVFVLGSHRGGTSVQSRAMQALGAFVGDSLLRGGYGNPLGFFEDSKVMWLNEAVLKDLNRNWASLDVDVWALDSEQFPKHVSDIEALLNSWALNHPLISIKDPRICLLFPLWESAAKNLNLTISTVLAVRNPISVAASLLKRNQINPIYGIQLWKEHLSKALKFVKSAPTAVVDYDQMVFAPVEQLDRLARLLDLPMASNEALEAFSYDFVTPKLRRNGAERVLDGEKVLAGDAEALELWEIVKGMSKT